ncbi:DUF3995 domain-containing protein [Nocardia sp. NPDC058633]|uniref:DUF3995 domain-containing protein n=1 Tax=Nocardia sp. NPDC058633 TaxID=3346568 RepID=UPI00364EAD66
MSAIAVTTAVLLFGVGLLHALWTVTAWPWNTRLDLARATMGWAHDTPPGRWFLPACLGVTALLAAAGCVLLLRADVVHAAVPAWTVTSASWAVAVILLARGVSGLLDPTDRSPNAPAVYRRLNQRAYSPFCLVLGGLAAVVAAS